MANARVERGKWRLSLVLLLLLGAVAFGAPPVAVDDGYTLSEDTVLTVDPPGVLGNDHDPDGDPLTATLLTSVTHGELIFHPDGSFTYTPDLDFYGSDQFMYRAEAAGEPSGPATVTITVLPVNDAPVAQDETLATRAGVPLEIVLVAEDADIDPDAPDAHPLTFSILEGPTHGSLSGDLTEVVYEAPHTALVNLVYSPAAGFVGQDRLVFQVTDELGESDRGVVMINVGGEGEISGTWEWKARWSAPFDLEWISSQLTSIYQRGELTLTGKARLTEDGLQWLRGEARLPLAEVIQAHTALKLTSTSTGISSYWDTRLSLDVAGVSVTWTAHLADSETSSYHRLTLRTAVGEAMLRSTTRFTGWGFKFDSQELYARWGWDTCDAQITARLTLRKTGFESLTLTARDIPLFLCPSDQDITLELKLRFTTTAKELTPAFHWPKVWVDCLQLLCELEADGATLLGLHVYGLRLRCELPDGMELELATSFSEEKNSALTGYASYFERWSLSGPLAFCCGEGEWKIFAYFEYGTTSLFSWGMTKLQLELDYASGPSVYGKLELRAVAPHWAWEWGAAFSF